MVITFVKKTLVFVFLCTAVSGFAQADLYQTLLQYRTVHDTQYRRAQMQAEIAANKAEKAKTESLALIEAGSGDSQVTLNADPKKIAVNTAPYAQLRLPSYNNTGLRVSVPYQKSGVESSVPGVGLVQSRSVGTSIMLSTDIYSKNAAAQKLTRDAAEDAATEAARQKTAELQLTEKRLLQDIQQLLQDYTAFLDTELKAVKSEIRYNTIKTQGYNDSSTKMRAAKLELLHAKREHQNAVFLFSASYREFCESCGITVEDDADRFLSLLGAAIPLREVEDINRYPPDAYKKLIEAEKLYNTNQTKRSIQNSPVSLSAEAGYSLQNRETEFSSQKKKENTHTVLGGLKMKFPGGTLYTGVDIPLDDPKDTSIRFGVSWNPLSIKYRRLDKKNAALESQIELLHIEDAKKACTKQMQTRTIQGERIAWQQKAAADELSIYKQNAEDHTGWYKNGVITRFEQMQAELEYKKAAMRYAKAKTAAIIFNIDIQLLFQTEAEPLYDPLKSVLH